MATQQPQRDLVWYRQFLRDKGYGDDQISYDNGAIKVDGNVFDYARPDTDGRAYGSLDRLENRWRTMQNGQRQQQIDQRNNQVMSSINQIQNTLQQRMNTPAPAFEYDPNDDPNYRAALKAAQKAATAGIGDTNAKLRASGQGKSSYSETVANQIMQGAIEDVNTNQLPVFMQQAYGQYRDRISDERNNMSDMLNVLNNIAGLNQQDFSNLNFEEDQAFAREQTALDNAYRDRAFDYGQEQDRVALAQWLTDTFGVAVQPGDDLVSNFAQVMELTPMARQQFDRSILESDRNFDRGVLESDRSYGLQNANLGLQWAQENRLASNQALDELYRVWENTGIAPEGIPGVPAGTPLFDARAGGGSTQTSGDLSANQFLSSIRDLYTEPVMDGGYSTGQTQMTADPNRREQMFLQVVDAGYDDATTQQILISLGMTTDEINRYLDKYGAQ